MIDTPSPFCRVNVKSSLILSVPSGSTVITPVPVFQIITLNPEPRVAAAVSVTVKVPVVQLMTLPRSPVTTVYAEVLSSIVSAEAPQPPASAKVTAPAPSVVRT